MNKIVKALLEAEMECLTKEEARREVMLDFDDVEVLQGQEERDLLACIGGINVGRTRREDLLVLMLTFPEGGGLPRPIRTVAFYVVHLPPDRSEPKLLRWICADEEHELGFYKNFHTSQNESANAEAPRFWNELKKVLVKPAVPRPYDPFDL